MGMRVWGSVVTLQVSQIIRNPNGSVAVRWAVIERGSDWQWLTARDLPQAASLLDQKCGAGQPGVILDMLNKIDGLRVAA